MMMMTMMTMMIMTTTAPMLRHHCTITAQADPPVYGLVKLGTKHNEKKGHAITAPRHHHGTRTAPHLSGPDGKWHVDYQSTDKSELMQHRCTIAAPSLHHHCTVTAPSLPQVP